jgi:hypothetical protein
LYNKYDIVFYIYDESILNGGKLRLPQYPLPFFDKLNATVAINKMSYLLNNTTFFNMFLPSVFIQDVHVQRISGKYYYMVNLYYEDILMPHYFNNKLEPVNIYFAWNVPTLIYTIDRTVGNATRPNGKLYSSVIREAINSRYLA